MLLDEEQSVSLKRGCTERHAPPAQAPLECWHWSIVRLEEISERRPSPILIGIVYFCACSLLVFHLAR